MSDTYSNRTITGATGSFIFNIIALVLIVIISITYGQAKRQQIEQEAVIQKQEQVRQNQEQERFNLGIISGEFKLTSGDCTPYCIITITGNNLLLKGIDYSGSNSVKYTETYVRSSNDKFTFLSSWDSKIQIKVLSSNQFSFSSPAYNRYCSFIKSGNR